MKDFRFGLIFVGAMWLASPVVPAAAAPNLCNGAPNGIVDGNEECETGPCCTSKCALESAATVCRPGTDAICNPAETCGTQSPAAVAACPGDQAAPNGAACNDGQFCTVAETCTNGTCGGGTANPCGDDNDCTDDECVENNDTCRHTKLADGTTCDDHSVCTTGDTCSNGLCVSGPPPTCQDDNPCTDDSCDPESGDCVFVNNTDPCSDALFCTAGDACAGGACVSGTGNGCDDGEGCTADLCNEQTDSCTHEPAVDGTSCEDDLFCTTGDHCTDGACVAGPPSACDDDNDCTKDDCDEGANECSHSATNNQGPCFDGSLCTTDDTCHNGVCEGGPAKFCFDGNPCTTDACSELTGDCAYTNSNGPCSDGNFCTSEDTCVAGVCVGGGSACTDGNPCTDDSCDEGLDECHFVSTTDPCSDGLFCTDGDACSGGACVPGPARNCADSSQCTDDTCNETTDQCEHANVTGGCEDGLFCTVDDECSGGVCVGLPRNCGDGNACTNDICNDVSDECDHLDNSAPCDDGVFCNGADTCAGGTCSVHPGDPCDGPDDDDDCSEVCSEEAGACSANDPDESPCSDGNSCTVGDECAAGVCVSGPDAGEGCVPTTTSTLEPTTTTLAPTTTTLEPVTTTTVEPTTTTQGPVTTTTVEGATTTTLAGGTTTTTLAVVTTTEQPTTTTAEVVTTTEEPATTTTTLAGPLCGDFDDDGELEASDALGILRTATDLDDCALSVCDFTGDGKITAIDALAVLRASVELPSDPSCPAATAAAAAPVLRVATAAPANRRA